MRTFQGYAVVLVLDEMPHSGGIVERGWGWWKEEGWGSWWCAAPKGWYPTCIRGFTKGWAPGKLTSCEYEYVCLV